MSILSELFKAAKPSWSGADRSELTGAVKRLTDKSGGIRALSRQLGIPLTSLNRGIATGFATSRADTLNRLSTAVSDAGTFFELRRKFSTALDFTTYQPGTIDVNKVQRPTQASGNPQTITIVATTLWYEGTANEGIMTRQITYDLGGMTSDEIIRFSGIDSASIERVIFSW